MSMDITAARTERQPQVKPRVVIIGGGISGLSAAWHLQQNGADVQYSVLEASERWGGKVRSERVDEFVIEAGPDSFLTQKPWALQLARELGLSDRLLGTNDRMRNVYVLHRGKPVKLPDGVMMIVPTKFAPFALSPLISPLGKLRMGMDLLIPAKRDDRDETLAEFVRRRLGSEALDKIAEPLMSGIYNAEADTEHPGDLPALSGKPEREHGSLICGCWASRRQPKHTPKHTPGAAARKRRRSCRRKAARRS
ncbi:MAG: protoporphyrinogen oxidase [Anaerolineae bacterium]